MDNTRLYMLVRDELSSFHGEDENHHYNWYLIEDDTSQGTLAPIPSMAHKFPYHPITSCLGSTIFILGGFSFRFQTISSDFLCFDINDDDDDDGGDARSGWIKVPSMSLGRLGNFTIAAGRKLYVFGGTMYTERVWGEVYDMESGKWSRLIPPNDLRPPVVQAGVLLDLDVIVDGDGDGDAYKEEEKRRVMLLYLPVLSCLISYQLETQEWEIYDSYFGSQWARTPFALSSNNNILLALNFEDRLLYGYHIMRRQWFTEPISGLDCFRGGDLMDNKYYTYIDVLSLGSSGKLCLFCSTRLNYWSPISVFCTQFTVAEMEGGQSLAAKVETTREFTIDTTGDLCYCLALPPGGVASAPSSRLSGRKQLSRC